METEKEILEFIRAGSLALPPLSFRLLRRSDRLTGLDQPDLFLETTCQGHRYAFVAEVKRYGSDKAVRQAADQARRYAQALETNPLVIVPWLSDEQLVTLEQRGVSGIDLCGNGVIVVPGQLLVFRTGQPNKFPTSRLIRRVYEGTSSLVARVFLLRPDYGSVSEILEEITARGGSITLPTISKSLKQMEEDLVIERSNGQIRLLQPDKLLDRLKANFEPPRSSGSLRAKLIVTKNANIRTLLHKAAQQADVQLVLSGESSVNFYATMAREALDTFYCTDITALKLQKFGVEIDSSNRFPNVELKKTDAPTVYFDMRNQSGYNVASPLQAYLELATSDKRGQETAEQIRRQILDPLAKKQRRRSK